MVLWLDLNDAREFLQRHDIPLPQAIVLGPEFLEHPSRFKGMIQKQVGYPCVVKAISTDILHKTDVGAVQLNVSNFDDLTSTIMRMQDALSKDHFIKGFLVEKQVEDIFLEVVIGVKHDASFDHVIMVGLGGIHVEILEDVTFRLLPISLEDAHDMLNDLHGKRLFEAVRGRPAINKDSLVALMVKISDLIMANPEIIELDLNPVGCNDKECTVLDVRMRMRKK